MKVSLYSFIFYRILYFYFSIFIELRLLLYKKKNRCICFDCWLDFACEDIIKLIFVSLFVSRQRNSVLISRLLDYTSNKQISKQQTECINQKIITNIFEGVVKVSDSIHNCNHYINLDIKENALNNIYESNDFLNYSRDLKIMSCNNRLSLRLITPIKMIDRRKMIKQQQIENKKKQEEEIKQNYMLKMKQWQAQKIEIQKRKKKQAQKKKLLQLNSEQKKKREEKEVKQFMLLFKKKSIQNKMKEIEQKKMERSRQYLQLNESDQLSQQKIAYKYIEYKKKFKAEQQQRKQEIKRKLKERSQSLQIDISQIIQHQKAYIKRIKQRLKIKSPNISNAKDNSQTDKIVQSFNINKKDPQQRKKIEEKIKRIKDIQNKIRLIPLKISAQKKKEIQIIGDKLKNKKKYIFLSEKALRDSQIYEQFKDFDIKIDKKDIGNHYLEQMRLQNQKSKILKVNSQKVVSVNKPQYKDYIKQIRQNKKNILNPDEFDSITKKIIKQKDKIDARHFLHEKSLHFEQKAMQKIHQLKSMDNYHDSIKKQGEIDNNYTKAIHAKLALAKIQ